MGCAGQRTPLAAALHVPSAVLGSDRAAYSRAIACSSAAHEGAWRRSTLAPSA